MSLKLRTVEVSTPAFTRALVAFLVFTLCLCRLPFAASAGSEKETEVFGEALFDCAFQPPSVTIPDSGAAKWMKSTALDAFTFLLWADGGEPQSSLQPADIVLQDLRLNATKSEVALTWAVNGAPLARRPELTLNVNRSNGQAKLSFTLLSNPASTPDPKRLVYWQREGKCVIARRAQ